MTQVEPRICECCGAVIPEEGLKLSPIQQKVYSFVARHPHCTIAQIHEHLYYHRSDGGANPATIHTVISQMNKKLVGTKIKSDSRGWWSTYSLVKDSAP